MTKSIDISPKSVLGLLLTIVLLLLFANLVSVYLYFVAGLEVHFLNTLYFDREFNFPTIFSTLTILLCAFLLWFFSGMESERKKRLVLFWKGLAVLFLFLALDEFFRFHEKLGSTIDGLVKGYPMGGYLYFRWVVPYAVFLGIISLLCLRSFYRLPRRTRALFIFSGIVYIAGALGMEMITGRFLAQEWDQGLRYALLATAEELLEMLGMVFFVYALLCYYLAIHNPPQLLVRFQMSPRKKEIESPPVGRIVNGVSESTTEGITNQPVQAKNQ